jgi:hypothetical protein
MREKFRLFVADVTRYGSTATLIVATLLCVPSLEEFFHDSLGATSMLVRFFIALGISTIGVRIASRTLLGYARQNLSSADMDVTETHGDVADAHATRESEAA